MKVPDRCIGCRFRSKEDRCNNYMEACVDIAQECKDDDDFQFIIETTKNRQWLTVDEIEELDRVSEIFKKEY